MHFFDTLLVPLMEYGSEIWYSKSAVDKLSVFQRNYFRRVLHVREKTPNNGVYGDLGIYPIELRLKNNVLKYLHHIHTLPETSPVKWVFKELSSLHEAGFSNWVTTAYALYDDHVISAGCTLESFLGLSKDVMKRKLKKSSQEEFQASWLSDINDSDKQPKLRTYKKFKSNLDMEPYLKLPSVKLRTAISRFRLSAHHLRIETGRHTKPYTPVENRLCLQCNENVIQDEEHHLIMCVAFANQRGPLLQCAARCISNFDNLSLEHKFIEIMKCENTELITALGVFLVEAANRT